MIDEKKLLDFVLDWKKWESKVDFYSHISGFIRKLNIKNSISFFGTPILKDKSPGYFRILWNSSKCDIDRTLLDSLVTSLSGKDTFKRYKKDSGEIGYIFSIGSRDSQLFWGELRIQEYIDDTKLEQKFFKYLLDGFSQLLMMTDKNKLLNLAFTDDVTGFFNQRKLIKDLNSLIRGYQQNQIPFSIMFVDIDHFKKVNDSHGHLVGSKLLRKLAQNMQKTLRDDDLLYRYGGDEFVLILPQTAHKVALPIGERIIANIKKTKFSFNEEVSFKLSVSIGVAEFPTDASDSSSILELADKMMYEAKKRGRGRVCYTQDIFDADGKIEKC